MIILTRTGVGHGLEDDEGQREEGGQDRLHIAVDLDQEVAVRRMMYLMSLITWVKLQKSTRVTVKRFR